MVYSVRVSDPRCNFSAAHFLFQHDKCSRIHGHNYFINTEISGKLNENFFVVDFFIIKSKLIEIASELDHAILLPAKSHNIKITKRNAQLLVDFNGKHYEFPEIDVRLLPIEATTAELLAKYVHDKLKENFKDYKLKVELGESEGSVAIYSE